MSGRISGSFGFQDVDAAERERRIRAVFEVVAPRYDLMNDVMSMGIHRLWKRAVAAAADPVPGQAIVDLAGGTGDLARLMAGPDRSVTVVDPSVAMMAEGRRRGGPSVSWLAGTAEAMPLADASVDTLTVAFGLRNVTSLEAALAEIMRVLKPDGRMLCLEFSRVAAPLRPFYDAYSFHVIPRLGAWVARQPAAYTYLVESIRKFPDQREMADLMRDAGFTGVGWRDFSFGIAALHWGRKPA